MATEPQSEVAIVHFASELFDFDAIKKAAYRLSDRVDASFELENGQVRCTLRRLTPKHDLHAIETEFRRHVLDYDLRARVAKETEAVRNLILSLAFSKTGLQG